MKLIIVGANGFVATEVIRQALRISVIDSLLAISRSACQVPSNSYTDSNFSKFRNLVVKDYESYDQETKAEFANADACIWSVFSCSILNRDITCR